jgi:hypothetical protein
MTNPAAAICAVTLGTGVVVITGRGLRPLARAWRKEKAPVSVEEGPAVWA